MSQDVERTTPVRVKNDTLEDINRIIIYNPVFKTPADVIEYAIKSIMRKEFRKK